MRKLTLIFLAIVLIAAPTIYAQDPATMAGNWLMEYQREDGSFDEDYRLTSLSVIALASVGQENEAALAWLESNFSEELDLSELSLAVTAVVATENDIGSFAEGALLANYTGALRAERGEDIEGLCYGLIARHSLGVALPETAVSGLVALQQAEDGGFGNKMGDPSDVLTTSACIHILAVAEQPDALEDALSFLQAVQLDDDGWAVDPEGATSDALATAFAAQALIAAGETLTDWGSPERTLFASLDAETGAFVVEGSDEMTAMATAIALPVFRGKSLISFGGDASTGEDSSQADSDHVEGPPLDPNWKLVGDGFGMDELDTADDFFVTVVDPFTDDELYGIQIINWTSEYQYTGYIVEQYMTADILIWMAEQESSTWDNITVATLELLPDEELAQLPDEIQALLSEQ